MKHVYIISILIILSVFIIGVFLYHTHLLWTGGQLLGCSDCSLITKIGPQTISNHFTCPSSWSGVDNFAGCVVYTYTEFALGPGQSANVCGSDSYCTAVIEYWGKCNARYTSEYKCNGNTVYRGYITTSCAHTFVSYKNCDSLDTCKGTTYYDYYCSNGQCVYKTYENSEKCGYTTPTPKGSINLTYIGAIGGGLVVLGLVIYLLLPK